MRDYRVLIIDDDAVDRQLYSKLLEQLDPDSWHLQQAVDGLSALTALRVESFDCLLLDYTLPGMNGLEFLTAAAVDGELPCAVVLITGQGDAAIAVEAMKRGVQDYLAKDDVNEDNLRRAVKQAVSQVELRRRLALSLRDLTAAHLALEQEIAIRKLAETELQTAEHASLMKTRFVTMVTHELRTPLNGILGYAQLLRLEGALSARQDMQVGAMIKAGRHLLEIVQGVLDFVSIETGRMELRPEAVSVRDLAEGCIVFISPMATERGLALRVVIAHDAPRTIVADSARLRQVLINLLGNAVKYTSEGSVELRMLAGATGDALRIEVCDTGCGVDEASRDRLFQDFERLDPASAEEGSGLGLAIAGRMVKQMGAEINHMPNPNAALDDRGKPAGGSVFWFELPATALPAPKRPDAALQPIPTGQRVLLVDDFKINLDIIGSFLSAAGHVVVLSSSGRESVRLAAEQRFDLVLMDLRMPDMDGLEAARRIRGLPGAHGQVPILALTAYTSPGQIAVCLDTGMNGHVSKPVDYDTLMRAIDEAIGRSPRVA